MKPCKHCFVRCAVLQIYCLHTQHITQECFVKQANLSPLHKDVSANAYNFDRYVALNVLVVAIQQNIDLIMLHL